MPVLIPGPGSDVVPVTDQSAADWLRNLADQYALDQQGAVSPVVAAFETLVSDFESALILATEPSTRTAISVADKNTTKAAAVAVGRQIARHLVNEYRAGNITGGELETYGIRIPDVVPSAISAPVTFPLLGLVSASGGQQVLRASDSATPDSRAKPFGASALHLYRSSALTAPANGDGSEFVGQFSRQPMIVSSPASLAGERIHYFARWVSAKGDTGPWSAAASFYGT